MSALATTLQAFFTDRLIRQRRASPNTLAAYRDSCGCCWSLLRPKNARSHRSWRSTISMPR